MDPQTPFERPIDGVFDILGDGADAEMFSAMLHYSRFGSLPRVDREELQHTSDFFLNRDIVDAALRKERQVASDKLETLIPIITVESNLALARIIKRKEEERDSIAHHNWRKDDGCGRVYCDSHDGCSSRDMDDRFFEAGARGVNSKASDYARCKEGCKECSVMVTYKKKLGWCHKCRLCLACQPTVCPDNDGMNCIYGYRPARTTKTSSDAMLNQFVGELATKLREQLL